jgi:hypothetical protein
MIEKGFGLTYCTIPILTEWVFTSHVIEDSSTFGFFNGPTSSFNLTESTFVCDYLCAMQLFSIIWGVKQATL